MESAYIQLLRDWEQRIGRPAIYANLDRLFPQYAFRRLSQNGPRDHWASRYKLDGSLPRRRNAEKTVVYQSDMTFREQGEWSSGIGVIDKLMQDNGLGTVFEAFAYVDNMFDLDMPRPDSRQVVSYQRAIDRRKVLLEGLRDYFSPALRDMSDHNAGKVRSYLRRRGFTPDRVEAFGFGFVPSWSEVMHRFTVRMDYTLEEFEAACGVRNYEGKTNVGRIYTLAIPYVSHGEIRGFLFRRVGEGSGPKYMATRDLDRKSSFFNMPAGQVDGTLTVVEGEFDALAATTAGYPAVVAIGGSEIAGERRRQVEDAMKRGVGKIILCLDLDADEETGAADFASRHAHLMHSIHTIKDVDPDFEEIYVAVFDAPTDPDEYIREKGSVAFGVLLRSAVPYWQYLYEYNVSGRPL